MYGTAGRSIPYRLGDDRSKDVAEYTYRYKRTSTRELNVGVKAGGVDVGVPVTSTLVQELQLEIRLQPGRDYRLRRLRDLDGLGWTIDTG